MSWLSEGLKKIKDTKWEVPTGVGAGITRAAKDFVPDDNLRNMFWDPSRDSLIGNFNYTTGISAKSLSGENPFSGDGDIAYNQNQAKRAAMIGAVFGGAALAGGGAAAGGAGAAVAPTVAAPVATTGAGTLAASGAAAPVSYGVGAGNVGGLGVMGGSGATGVGAAGAAAPSVLGPAGYAGTTMGAEAVGAGLAGSAAAVPAAPAAAGSWAPYAMAGGSILSTLFNGLLQVERDKEQRAQEIQMARARAAIENAQLQSSALDRLTQVWRR